jgi:two-component system, NarL family, invasion response regulator UvrY
MAEAINILIGDDHAIVREGMIRLLKDEFGDALFTEAKTGAEVLEKARSGDWDIIIMDITMPGRSGLEILKQLRSESIDTPVLVLSMYPEDQYAVRVMRAGASGYLTKDTAPEELVQAVKKVLSGRKYISESLGERLAEDLNGKGDRAIHELMSDREYQVMCLIASGKTVSEIAEELSLSVPTISTYRARILEKLNMRTNAEITRFAIESGLV